MTKDNRHAAGVPIRLVARDYADDSLENLAELVTVAEAAAWLGITRWTAYEMAKRGELPCVRIGRRVVRIPRAALASLINGPNPPAKG